MAPILVKDAAEGHTKLLLFRQKTTTATLNAETRPNKYEQTCDLPMAMLLRPCKLHANAGRSERIASCSCNLPAHTLMLYLQECDTTLKVQPQVSSISACDVKSEENASRTGPFRLP